MDPTAAKRLSMSYGRLMGQDHIKPIEARLSDNRYLIGYNDIAYIIGGNKLLRQKRISKVNLNISNLILTMDWIFEWVSHFGQIDGSLLMK